MAFLAALLPPKLSLGGCLRVTHAGLKLCGCGPLENAPGQRVTDEFSGLECSALESFMRNSKLLSCQLAYFVVTCPVFIFVNLKEKLI